ncbi:MAG TPA: caspase family protein [Streptosporangiaceae bacterium]|nr:caspase family protein [Streptosporangiaceae bacterium]
MRSQAVLIGGCHYQKLADLEAVHNNLTVLAKELCASDIWGLPADNCVTVEDPAMADEMLDPVLAAAEKATDTLLVYYAGHGLVGRRGELHLALVGSESDPQRMYKAVPYDHIRDALLESGAARRIVILDCCYSGRALGQMAAASATVADGASADGTYVLAASSENKSALAPPGKIHTAFTGELLSIIHNGITIDDPFLDLDSIYQQLLRTTKTKGYPEPQKRDRNTAGQLMLIRNRAYRPPAVAPPPDADHYDMVLQQMVDEGNLVLFLGSRSGELAAKLAERFGLKTPQDLPDIAQYIYVRRGRPDLYRALRQILSDDLKTEPVHRFLARFPRTLEELGVEKRYQLIISTSFDMALERAFDEEREPYDLAIYMASGPDKGKFVHFPSDGPPRPVVSPNSYTKFPIGMDYELERTLIVKPYGAVDGSIGDYRWKENYIITRDHYINYLTRSPIEALVPVQILAKLQDSHCLFLDPTRDWLQRIFLDRVWQGTLEAISWAVEPDADQFEKDSWAQANVHLYAADLAHYVDQLQKRLALRTK